MLQVKYYYCFQQYLTDVYLNLETKDIEVLKNEKRPSKEELKFLRLFKRVDVGYKNLKRMTSAKALNMNSDYEPKEVARDCIIDLLIDRFNISVEYLYDKRLSAYDLKHIFYEQLMKDIVKTEDWYKGSALPHIIYREIEMFEASNINSDVMWKILTKKYRKKLKKGTAFLHDALYVGNNDFKKKWSDYYATKLSKKTR